MFFLFYFADGYRCACRGFDSVELAAEVRKHGEIVKVEKA
jgi:hypothetical protein